MPRGKGRQKATSRPERSQGRGCDALLQKLNPCEQRLALISISVGVRWHIEQTSRSGRACVAGMRITTRCQSGKNGWLLRAGKRVRPGNAPGAAPKAAQEAPSLPASLERDVVSRIYPSKRTAQKDCHQSQGGCAIHEQAAARTSRAAGIEAPEFLRLSPCGAEFCFGYAAFCVQAFVDLFRSS